MQGKSPLRTSAKERKNLVDRYIHDAINTVGQVHRPEVSLPASIEQMTPLLTTARDLSTTEPISKRLPRRLAKLKKLTFESGNAVSAQKAALAHADVHVHD